MYRLSVAGGQYAKDNIYVFNTFAYSCLRDEGINGGAKVAAKWIENSGVDVFEKGFLLLPVNYSMHWSLAVVCNIDSLVKAHQQHDKPCVVFHLDSCSGCHNSKDINRRVKHLIKELFLSWTGPKSEWDPKKVKTYVPNGELPSMPPVYANHNAE